MLDDYTTAKANPGPGTYQDVHIMKPHGNYFVSKYKAAKCRIIAPARSKRFKMKVRGKYYFFPFSFLFRSWKSRSRNIR